MSALTDYAENAVLNHLLRNVAMASPAAVYVALFTANPGETGSTSSEVVPGANAYERKVVTFGAPVNGVVSTTAALTWANMPTTTVSHVGLMDALTGGNMLYYGATVYPVAVAAGEPFTLPTGALTASLA